MLVPIENLGEHGILKDIPPHKLPLNAFSDGRAVAFREGVVRKAFGLAAVITPTVAPYAIFSTPSPDTNFWCYAGTAKIHAFLGSTPTDITRVSGNYTGTEYNLWNGGMFQGIPFFNNGVDVPQVWSPIALATKLVDMPNWTAAMRAAVVRPFKNWLVALDVSKSGTRNIRMVKWSDTAEPGSLPLTWDETDATRDSGEVTLSEGEDALIDCCQLGDLNIIYGKASTWAQRQSGDSAVFGFYKLFDTAGLLAQNCARPFRKQHFVVTHDDLVVHNGSQIESVVDAKLKSWLFNNLTSSAAGIAQVIPFYRLGEMWVLLPMFGEGTLNLAAIWNWKYNTWTLRDFTGLRAAASSFYTPGASLNLWDFSAPETWEQGEGAWGTSTSEAARETMMISPAALTGVKKVDYGFADVGTGYNSYVKRESLDVAGISRDGQLVRDAGVVKNCRGLWPQIEADAGAAFDIRLGSQMHPDEAISWTDPVEFVPGANSPKVDLYRTGRFISYWISDKSGTADWKLKSVALDIVPLGAL